MEPLRGEPIHAREVLIAQQFQRIIDALKQNSAIDLQLRQAAQFSTVSANANTSE